MSAQSKECSQQNAYDSAALWLNLGGDGISVWKGHKYVKGGSRIDYCDQSDAANPECACVNVLIRDVVCDRNYRQGEPARR